jgi:diacylglycerol O-acyltransferase / wax synthase
MDRLSALDVSFLYLEQPATPMHVGGLLTFEPPAEGFDYDGLVDLIGRRIRQVPRYRQKIKWVPGNLASPVWTDDPDFDLAYHVRRSALPRPGSDEQLRELVARLISRPLDRTRPLWELYLIEGLAGGPAGVAAAEKSGAGASAAGTPRAAASRARAAGGRRPGRVAILTKTHHAMVDGISAIDLATVILDVTPQPRQTEPDLWMPQREPSSLSLVTGAVREIVQRPTAVLDTVRMGFADARAVAGRAVGVLGGLTAAARVVARPAPGSPLNVSVGEQRRFGTARTALDDYKKVRKAHGGTVNDVVLATCSGALRNWLLSRGEPVVGSTVIRAMVPVSVRSTDQQSALGNRVSSMFVDLPVGEPNAVVRLSRISYAMKVLKDSGQSVGADALVRLAGFAAPTLHAAGARVANRTTHRLFNLVITNVPGPQFPLYANGARMLEVFPAVPLVKNTALSIGLISYDGGVYYGLTADRDALPDVDLIGTLITESLEELVETVR